MPTASTLSDELSVGAGAGRRPERTINIMSPPKRPSFWAWGWLCTALTRLAHSACSAHPIGWPSPHVGLLYWNTGKGASKSNPSAAQAVIPWGGTTVTPPSAHSDCFLPTFPSLELLRAPRAKPGATGPADFTASTRQRGGARKLANRDYAPSSQSQALLKKESWLGF